jgi:hypothetical protein
MNIAYTNKNMNHYHNYRHLQITAQIKFIQFSSKLTLWKLNTFNFLLKTITTFKFVTASKFLSVTAFKILSYIQIAMNSNLKMHSSQTLKCIPIWWQPIAAGGSNDCRQRRARPGWPEAAQGWTEVAERPEAAADLVVSEWGERVW